MLHPDILLLEHAGRRHHVFTVADARRCGLSDSQIARRGRHVWQRLHGGVYALPGAAVSWRGRLLAATLAGGDRAAASHRAAAEMFGVPGRQEIVEITCRRWARTRAPGIVVHEGTRLPAADVTTVDGIPVVSPELMVLQLAALKPVPAYVEAVVQALRRRRLVTFGSMHEAFARHARRGLPGVRATRLALERWDPASAPTESEMETMLVQVLRDHGLPEPVTQFEVLDEHGALVARTDAALPRWRITVEYESMQEHSDEFQLARDARRRNRIVAAGYVSLTARIGDLRNGGHELADEIRRIMRRHERGA